MGGWMSDLTFLEVTMCECHAQGHCHRVLRCIWCRSGCQPCALWEMSPSVEKLGEKNQVTWDFYFLGATLLSLHVEELFREKSSFRKHVGLLTDPSSFSNHSHSLLLSILMSFLPRSLLWPPCSLSHVLCLLLPSSVSNWPQLRIIYVFVDLFFPMSLCPQVTVNSEGSEITAVGTRVMPRTWPSACYTVSAHLSSMNGCCLPTAGA